MKLLKHALIISGLIEFLVAIQIYFEKNLQKFMQTGFITEENLLKNETIIFFYISFLIILGLTRIHCAFDIHSKSIYRLTLLIHLTEALLFVGRPLIQGRIDLKNLPISLSILIIPTWMILSYNSYLSIKSE